MTKDKDIKTIVPSLRFPEFRDSEGWEETTLNFISNRITNKVRNLKLPPVSISAGIGFVTQTKKFGRDISGEQYKNYIILNYGDFAYNKGNSKRYPQGCIYKLTEFNRAAAPNAFICFRFKDNVISDFYKGYFENNCHGKQLQRFITSSARSDGLLNISPKDFFNIKLPTPRDYREQQKIADCLGSFDDLISAVTDKIEALKDYKKGLMQQLFPAEGQTTPTLRFPEFQNKKEWIPTQLGQCLLRHPEYGLNAPAVPYSDKLPVYLRITDISDDGKFISTQKVSVDRNVSNDNYLEEGDIVLARTGASVGKSYKYKEQDGKLVFAGFLIRIKPNKEKVNSDFIYQFLLTERYWCWVNFTSTRSGQPGINGNEYSSMPLQIPRYLDEQKKIADCLSSVDELISAENSKLDQLKAHKKGLMQQLFPSTNNI